MFSRLSMAWRTRAAGRERQRGGVAVEFALVLPLLITLLLGIVTAGVAYSQSLGVTNAVREGARFGATTVNDGAWEGAVVTRTRTAHFDSWGSSTQICARLVRNPSTTVPAIPTEVVRDTASCGAGSAPSAPEVEPGKCVAMVWAARDFQIDTGLLPPFTGTIRRQSVARYERDC